MRFEQAPRVGLPVRISENDPLQLDPTFGDNGTVRTDLKDSWDYCRDVAVQADGKILVLGLTEDQPSSKRRLGGSYHPDEAWTRPLAWGVA